MLPWSTKAVICNLDLHFVPVTDKPDGPVLEICVARKTGKQTHRLVAKLDYLASSCSWVDESSVPRMDVATADARVHLASLAVAITPTGALVATLVATSDLKPFRSEICIPVRMKPTGVPAPVPAPSPVPDVPVSAPDAPEPSPVPVDDGQTEPGAPDEEMDLDGESGGRKRILDTVETREKPVPPVKKHRQSRHQSDNGEGQSLVSPWTKEQIASFLEGVEGQLLDKGEDFEFTWKDSHIEMSLLKQKRRALVETPVYICPGKLIELSGQSNECMEWNPTARTKVFWTGPDEEEDPCLWSVSQILGTGTVSQIAGKGQVTEKGTVPKAKSTKCFMPDIEEEPHFPVFFHAIQHGILSPELFKTAFALWWQDAVAICCICCIVFML